MNLVEMSGWAGCGCAGAIALFVALERCRILAPWALVAGMLVSAAGGLLLALSATAGSLDDLVDLQRLRLMVFSLLPGCWLGFSLSYARGNASESLRKWRFILLGAVVLPVTLAFGFSEDLIVSASRAGAGGPWLFVLGGAGILLNLLWLLSSILVLMNLEQTFRASVGTLRWRIKFMLLGMGVILVVRAYVASQVLLFHGTLDLALETFDILGLLLGGALILRGLARQGHFDTDIYPSRSTGPQSLTVLLAGIYLVAVGLFAKFVEFLGGSTAFALKAFFLLVLVVLAAVLAVSDRARFLARRFASRHFQKPMYDYRSLWRKFSNETASCVREPELCAAAVKLTAEVFQALSVSLWLLDEKRESLRCAAATFLSEDRAEVIASPDSEVTELIRILENRPDPFDLDAAGEPWAELLRRRHPEVFRLGGHRLCLALVNGGQMLGVLVLGDRVVGTPFCSEDFDLLKCLADSTAAGLRNIQLSQKLLQAGQLEAFRAMSAFFVHDLKNTASALSLMLQNLPRHYDDPAFRADTLRGISRTVAHVNSLIARLGQLRAGLQIHPAVTDLNALVNDAVQAVTGGENSSERGLVTNLRPLPPLLLDREQMLKVVANLVFNAREAVAADGEVRIETFQKNGGAILSVSDNGCGMPPEFLRRSLFQPFQTTKKNGLGIGLFQSKMIVEAHQGKIDVVSEPGRGTTFQIILPVQKVVS